MQYFELQKNLEEFQNLIGYKFKKTELLITALTHRSYLNEKNKFNNISEHNERLEFLGDAVVELVVTDFLYTKFSTEPEGFLTTIRASLVNYKNMSIVGAILGLDIIILLSSGEKAELGKARPTIVADCFEAIIGALFLDGGIEIAKEFIHKYLLPTLADIIKNQSYKDNKTQLQELTQKLFHITPRYKIVFEQGKDHNKEFTVNILLDGKIIAEATGSSKQEAELAAAGVALNQLKETV